jgi:DNA-binding SARP family transcriptional activator
MDGRDEFGISVCAFGGFSLVINDQAVSRWRGGKACNLLQLMLLREGRIMSRETLYEALWPDLRTGKDSSSLKVAVHMLRRVIDTEPTRRGSSIRLLTCDDGYVLHTDNVWTDFQVFDRLIDEGHQAQIRGERACAAAAFREAMELYQGDFLPNVWMDWADLHREWLRSRALLALEWLIEADFSAGENLAVIRWCRLVLEIDPYREAAYRWLMLVHARFGHLDQVRRWYGLCRTRLESGLEIAPAPSTRKLLQEALRGDFAEAG